MKIEEFTKKNLLPIMIFIGIIQVVCYYIAGTLAKVDGPGIATLQPDTLLYCQAAKRIVEGFALSFSNGEAPSTGTTSTLYPFVLAIPYALGAKGDSLLVAGFFLNAAFYLVFLLGWGLTLKRWVSAPVGQLVAGILLSLFGQPAFCAMAQSDIGFWMALSGFAVYGLASNNAKVFIPLLALAPWLRPEGMILVLSFGIVLMLFRIGGRKIEKTEILAFALGCLSIILVFSFNYIMTGMAQFSGVLYKGYFKNKTFADAVMATWFDAITIVKDIFFGFGSVSPRVYYIFPIIGSLFLWLGIFTKKYDKRELPAFLIWLMAIGGGIFTVATSGWQNTNTDRYLAWVLPIIFVFIGEGVVYFTSIAEKIRFSKWLPIGFVFIFALLSMFSFICMFYSTSISTDRLRIFAKICYSHLGDGPSVASSRYTGLAYEFGTNRFVSFSGVYSPVFLQKYNSSKIEILKHNPKSRFDYIILDTIKEYSELSDADKKIVFGETIAAGPDNFELRKMNYDWCERAMSHIEIPEGLTLVTKVDVGHKEDEVAHSYKLYSRYGGHRGIPFVVAGPLNDKEPILEGARLVVGSDEMRLNEIDPDKDVFVVMRSILKADAIWNESYVNVSFNKDLDIDVFINDNYAGRQRLTFNDNGISDATFVIPKGLLNASTITLRIGGDRIACGYWFYQ